MIAGDHIRGGAITRTPRRGRSLCRQSDRPVRRCSDDESARQRRARFPRGLQVRIHFAPLSRSAREHVSLSSRPVDESFGSGTVDSSESISCRNAETFRESSAPARAHSVAFMATKRRCAFDLAARAQGVAAPLRTGVRTDDRGAPPVAVAALQSGQVSPSPLEDALPISTDRGDGTRPRCRCVPAARDLATGTCPTASQDRARTPSRCGTRRRRRVRRRLCRGPRA
jgi:hypothetical protein